MSAVAPSGAVPAPSIVVTVPSGWRMTHQATPARPLVVGLDDAHRERGGDRGIHRVPAGGKDPDAGFGRERMLGRDHAAGRDRLGLGDIPDAARRHRWMLAE